MLGIFDATAGDKSLEYLYKIFGSMNGVIQAPASGDATVSITLLGTMFSVFNSIVLAIGAFVVVYVTVVGVIMTAQEGEFMGKKWNNIWIPIRTVIGIGALVPTGSGYSGLQIIMMWVIVQGIGAADTVWNTVLGYVTVMGSPYAQTTIPSGNVKMGTEDLFKGLMCAKAAAQTYDNPTVFDQTRYFCQANKKDKFCQTGSNQFSPSLDNTNKYSMGPGGSCGVLKFCDEDKVKDKTGLEYKACEAQIYALKQIIPTLATVADKFVQVDYEYLSFFNAKDPSNAKAPAWVQQYCSDPDNNIVKCYGKGVKGNPMLGTTDIPNGDLYKVLNPQTNPMNTASNKVTAAYYQYALQSSLGDTNFINTSVGYYTSQIALAVQEYMQSQGTKAAVRDDLKEAQAQGWIMAGGYYYAVTRQNSSNLKEAMPVFKVEMDNTNTPASEGSDNKMYDYRNNFAAATKLINLAAGKEDDAPSNPGMESAGNALSEQFSSALGGKDKSSNPLAQIAIAGYGMLISVQIAFAIFIVVGFIVSMTSNINILALGTGLTENPLGPAFQFLYSLLVPLLFLLLGFMVTVGGLLSVYVPLIPFIVFVAGAIGWLTSCIEAMVAGPLVALGILSPSAHSHEIMGKGEHAIMLLFAIFMRPVLMIFGLVAAMLLASVVVGMVNEGFKTAIYGVGSIIAGSTKTDAIQGVLYTNPVGMCIMLAAYVSLIVTSLNKCFAAIHIIPENVMGWIGAKGASYGEGDMLSDAKHKSEGAATGAKGAASPMRESVQQGAKAAADSKKPNAKVGDGGKPPAT